jgi:hypothetical protein
VSYRLRGVVSQPGAFTGGSGEVCVEGLRRIAALVAHHSSALFEAEEHGLREELVSEFAQELSQATVDVTKKCASEAGDR